MEINWRRNRDNRNEYIFLLSGNEKEIQMCELACPHVLTGVCVCVCACVRAFTSASVRAHARAWSHMCVCECVSQVSEKGKGEVGKRKIVVRFRAKLNRTGAQRGRSLGCFPGRGKPEFKRASASKAADILL